MVRHKRIVLALVTVAAAFFSAALAPAAGDQRVTGSSAQLSYTEDGVPIVRSGPECKGGKAPKHAHAQPDASDY